MLTKFSPALYKSFSAGEFVRKHIVGEDGQCLFDVSDMVDRCPSEDTSCTWSTK